MSSLQKLILGILAILPLIVTCAMFGAIFYLVRTDDWRIFQYSLDNPVAIPVFNLALLILLYGPNIFYLVHAGRNPNLHDRKVAWIILMVLFGVFAMPIYWFQFIWRAAYYEAE